MRLGSVLQDKTFTKEEKAAHTVTRSLGVTFGKVTKGEEVIWYTKRLKASSTRGRTLITPALMKKMLHRHYGQARCDGA